MGFELVSGLGGSGGSHATCAIGGSRPSLGGVLTVPDDHYSAGLYIDGSHSLAGPSLPLLYVVYVIHIYT